jgi:hypothetical protein
MPRMGASKDSLEGSKPLPIGFYDFRLDGFNPKPSKDKGSVNFNPTMKVINNANGLNDNRIFLNLNQKAGWIQKDFVHALGFQMEVIGEEAYIPGEWTPDPTAPDDVTKMKYNGPLLGRTGRCEVGLRKDDKGKDQSYVKQLVCKVPGCQEKHSTDLK